MKFTPHRVKSIHSINRVNYSLDFLKRVRMGGGGAVAPAPGCAPLYSHRYPCIQGSLVSLRLDHLQYWEQSEFRVSILALESIRPSHRRALDYL